MGRSTNELSDYARALLRAWWACQSVTVYTPDGSWATMRDPRREGLDLAVSLEDARAWLLTDS